MVLRVSVGNHGDGSFGLRISRPGFDVDLATDAQLAMDSDWVIENVFASGEFLVPKLSSGSTTIVDCSALSYVPYARIFINFQDQAASWLGMPMLYRKLVYWDANILKMGHDVVWNPAGDDVRLIYFVYARPVA